MQTQKLNKAQDAHRSASTDLPNLQTKRKEMNQKFIENLENHQKADDVLRGHHTDALKRNESNDEEDNALIEETPKRNVGTGGFGSPNTRFSRIAC